MKRGKKYVADEVLLERENKIWELRTKSWTQDRIAKEVGISQVSVGKTLKRLTEKYAKELMEDIITVKRMQVTQLEHISDEALQAWEKSKKPTKTMWVKRPLQSDGTPSSSFGEQTQEARDQNGDQRYLTAAMKAKEDIRKIIGADAPTKSFNYNKDISSMSDEELQSIVNGKETGCDS